MAANRPPGDNARKGAVHKRSQLKTKVKARSIGRSEAVKMAIHGSEERPQGEAQGHPPRTVYRLGCSIHRQILLL
jgi:hypothetical protein